MRKDSYQDYWDRLIYGPSYDLVHKKTTNAKPKQKAERNFGPVSIERVDFNGPATIIFWSDQTKTVAKCDKEDTYDKAKGFLIAWGKKNAIKKEALIDAIDKWCPDAFTRPEPKKEQKKETKKTVKENPDKFTNKQFDDALSLIDDMLELGLLLRLLK